MKAQEQIDLYVRNKIYNYVHSGKIKSVSTLGGLVINFHNFEDYGYEIMRQPLLLSRKNLKYFIDDNTISYVYENFIDDKRNHLIVTSKDKVIDFDISLHAKEQFLKRYIFINEEMSQPGFLSSDDLEYYNFFKDNVYNLLEKNNYDDEDFHNLMITKIKASTNFTKDNTSRKKDKVALNYRDNKYNNTNRLYNHPFLFIFEDRVLKTCELYSQMKDFRDDNAITSDNNRFRKWLDEKKSN